MNIVLLVKDGARWKDNSGAPTCNFLPYDLINALPEVVHPAFDSKAITHSDEYYQVRSVSVCTTKVYYQVCSTVSVYYQSVRPGAMASDTIVAV